MLGFIKDKAQQAKALVGEAVEASASAIVSSDSPSVLVLEGEKQGEHARPRSFVVFGKPPRYQYLTILNRANILPQ